MLIPWADDDFVGEDKLTHATYCYALALTFRLFGVPPVVTFLVVMAFGVAVELGQWILGTDQPSWRDLVADCVGDLLGIGVYAGALTQPA